MANIIIGMIVGLLIGLILTILVIRAKAKKKIDNFIVDITSSNETVKQFLNRYLSDNELEDFINGIKSRISMQIYSNLSDSSVSESISHHVFQALESKLSTHNDEKNTSKQGFFGNAFSAVKDAIKNRVENVVMNEQSVIEQTISDKIHDIIISNGKDIISDIVDAETDKILSKPLASLFGGNEKTIHMIKQRIASELL